MEEQTQSTEGLTFLQRFAFDVENYTQHTARYAGLLLEMNVSSLEKLGDNDKQQIVDFLQRLRYYGYRAYIGYLSIMETKAKKDQKTKDKMKQLADHLQTTMYPEQEKAESLLLEFNKFLLLEVTPNFMQTKQDIVADMVGQ